MRINIGHAVEGDNFFGRAKELKRMREVLTNKKASIFIPGPRRIGKTSLVKEFILRNSGRFKFIYFDLEGRNSLVELCKDLIAEIEKKFPDLVGPTTKLKEKWNILSNAIREIEIKGFKIKTGEIAVEVKEILDRMEAVFEALAPHHLIVAFDEFSDFLLNLENRNPPDVKFFLEWLRRMRQAEKAQFIITGSINVLTSVEKFQLTYLINDMTDVDILPLSSKEVESLLADLLRDKHITLSDTAMDFAVGKLCDGTPFYVQLFADSLSLHFDEKYRIDDVAEIAAIYGRITHKQHKEFIDLHSRLKTHLAPIEYKGATRILAHACVEQISFDDIYPFLEKDLPDKADVNRILRRLADECYLKKESGRYSFVSPLLADWWKNTYEWER